MTRTKVFSVYVLKLKTELSFKDLRSTFNDININSLILENLDKGGQFFSFNFLPVYYLQISTLKHFHTHRNFLI